MGENLEKLDKNIKKIGEWQSISSTLSLFAKRKRDPSENVTFVNVHIVEKNSTDSHIQEFFFCKHGGRSSSQWSCLLQVCCDTN